MFSASLLPRPHTTDRPRVADYTPTIGARIERINRRKRNSWRCTATVDGQGMATSHHDTRADAERHGADMIEAYAEAHYIRT